MNTKPCGKTELIKALIAFQGSCPPVPFDKVGQVGPRTYGYASLNAILSAVRGPLSAAGLGVTQAFDGNGCLVTTLHHVAGGSIESKMPLNLQGLTMQQAGSAITYSKRYALAALLLIGSEEDDDGDAATAARNGLKNQLVDSIALEGRANGITRLKERLREFSRAGHARTRVPWTAS
jgi:ERF superfamily protein